MMQGWRRSRGEEEQEMGLEEGCRSWRRSGGGAGGVSVFPAVFSNPPTLRC